MERIAGRFNRASWFVDTMIQYFLKAAVCHTNFKSNCTNSLNRKWREIALRLGAVARCGQRQGCGGREARAESAERAEI